MIDYQQITKENFRLHSLDGFVRHQVVKAYWRRKENEWILSPCDFTQEWDEEKLREVEKDIIKRILHGFGYMALDREQLVGFAFVDDTPIGNRGEYLELTDFQVSFLYRKQGIGKKLFLLAAEHAKKKGAEKLYISTHPSEDSHAAYHALGCEHALWIYDKKVQEEPEDIQMEYLLHSR